MKTGTGLRLRRWIVLLLAAVSCSTPRQPDSSLPKFEERKFNDRWSMDAKALELFKANVNAINLNDDIVEVVKKLGAPD
jgi:hypothetical protein